MAEAHVNALRDWSGFVRVGLFSVLLSTLEEQSIKRFLMKLMALTKVSILLYLGFSFWATVFYFLVIHLLAA